MLNTLALKLEKLPFAETGYFSQGFVDYVNEATALQEFYQTYPTLDNFQQLISQRTFPQEHRQVLTKVIGEQYSGLVQSGKMIQNLAQLSKSTCFTVTTGHQLNIFTGPLYFIYKIVTTIKACEALATRFPDHQFVPVYWMASEDHDFEEINHFNLFGKQHSWETNQQGAVGRFDTAGLSTILEELRECPEVFKEAYASGKNLAQATRYIVNELFGDQGLIVVDADHADLKSLFIPVMEDELMHHHAYGAVLKQSERIQELGYKTLVTPREINLFYLTDNSRLRIVKRDGRYEVLGTDINFDAKELKALLQEHPERFSPNVVLRTLYQETILPNLAYIGGPGELNYWLQFKGAFDHYNLKFPALMPRNCALYVNRGALKKMHKLDLDIKTLFKDEIRLKKEFVEDNSQHNLDLDPELNECLRVFDSIRNKATQVDGSLGGFINAEEAKFKKALAQITKRIKKAEEQKQEVSVNQLMNLKSKLFPSGGLQERHDNLLSIYLNNPNFIQEVMEQLDPFDFQFHIIMEDG